MISLSKQYGEDAEEVKAVLMMFGGLDAEIVSIGRRATGPDMARAGAAQAERHANETAPGWSDKAFEALCEFVRRIGPGRKFQAEDVRMFANVPPAPSLRAWGNIMVRAAKAGIIRNTGITEKVNNATAHSANASVWVVA
jgi:hypothetical protein